MSEETTTKARLKLAQLSDAASSTIRAAKTTLDQARALTWALDVIYDSCATKRGPSLDDKIRACVDCGFEVAHISDAQARMMPSNDHLEWFAGAGWYVDLSSPNDVTYPIGPFESAAEGWEEAYIAYNLGGK